MSMMPKLAIIGAGNMGQGLLRGLILSGYSLQRLMVIDPNTDKCLALESRWHVETGSNPASIVNKADIIILAIKPQILAKVVPNLAINSGQTSPLIISLAAGATISQLDKWLEGKAHVIRAIPNMPSAVGAGATALFALESVPSKYKEKAADIMKMVGDITWVQKESDLNIITALSGSGPAYFYYFMAALAKSAEQNGLSPEIAQHFAALTAKGAALMALEENASLEELQQQVTSPGGTTAAALTVFEQEGLKNILNRGVSAAILRAQELALNN